jgi:hypothetical protein
MWAETPPAGTQAGMLPGGILGKIWAAMSVAVQQHRHPRAVVTSVTHPRVVVIVETVIGTVSGSVNASAMPAETTDVRAAGATGIAMGTPRIPGEAKRSPVGAGTRRSGVVTGAAETAAAETGGMIGSVVAGPAAGRGSEVRTGGAGGDTVVSRIKHAYLSCITKKLRRMPFSFSLLHILQLYIHGVAQMRLRLPSRSCGVAIIPTISVVLLLNVGESRNLNTKLLA